MSRRTVALLTAVVWTFVLAGAVAIFFIFAQGSNPFTNFNPIKGEMKQLQQQTVNDEVTSISIEWIAGGVHIKKAADGKLQLVEKSQFDLDMKQWAAVTVNNGKLTIKSRIKSVWNIFTFFTPSSYLELYLPEKLYERLDMESTSGEYIIENLQVEKLNVKATSGNFDIRGTTSEDLFIDVTSGNLKIDQVVTDSFHLKMTSGDTSFSGVVGESWKAVMTSGRIRANLLESAPTDLDVNMTSGLIEMTFVKEADFLVTVEKTSGLFNANWPGASSSSPYKYQSGRDDYRVSMTSGVVTFKIQP
jgi:lia operon protein LiaG